MRLLIVFSMAAMVLSAADGRTAQKNTKPKGTPIPPKMVQIPAGAAAISPVSYRYTGPDGKTLLYTKTPFGVTVAEERRQAAAAEDHRLDAISATEDGDSVQFARPTPFGTMRWQRKKAELNQIEQAVWDREISRQVLALEPTQQAVPLTASGLPEQAQE
ncbi:MAG TPA: hypothetical protein VGF16_06575 [Bryobacteraceae bacterium]|jgi:hypothetical protein